MSSSRARSRHGSQRTRRARSLSEQHHTARLSRVTQLLLDAVADCPDPEFAIGEAHRRAADALSELLVQPGEHHLTAAVEIRGESFTARCAAHKPQGALHIDRQLTELLFALVAAALAGGTGGLVCRTSDPVEAPVPDRPCAVYGWAILDGALIPLTSAQIFNAECVDHVTGEPIPPEPAVTYIDAPELPGGRPG